MNLQRPLEVVTPTLDGDILSFLARADKAFTGREIHRGIGRASQEGVRLALERLVAQGIVLNERAGNAILFHLNRQHLASPFIEGLALLRLQLIARLREQIDGWNIQPAAAALFGSAGRGEGDAFSDLDLLVIRPESIEAEDEAWCAQLSELEERAMAWTGNDAQILEYGEREAMQQRGKEPVLDAAIAEGVQLAGSLRRFTRAKERRQ